MSCRRRMCRTGGGYAVPEEDVSYRRRMCRTGGGGCVVPEEDVSCWRRIPLCHTDRRGRTSPWQPLPRTNNRDTARREIERDDLLRRRTITHTHSGPPALRQVVERTAPLRAPPSVSRGGIDARSLSVLAMSTALIGYAAVGLLVPQVVPARLTARSSSAVFSRALALVEELSSLLGERAAVVIFPHFSRARRRRRSFPLLASAPPSSYFPTSRERVVVVVVFWSISAPDRRSVRSRADRRPSSAARGGGALPRRRRGDGRGVRVASRDSTPPPKRHAPPTTASKPTVVDLHTRATDRCGSRAANATRTKWRRRGHDPAECA